MIRRLALLCLAGAVGLLAACTSGGDNGKSGGAVNKGLVSGKAAPLGSGSATAPRATAGLVQPTDLPTTVPNSVSLRTSVALTSCGQIAGGWHAGGTAKNTRDAKFTYELTVFFTTDQATVIGFATTKLTVAAGKTAKWTVSKKFPAVKNTKCVLRGVGKG